MNDSHDSDTEWPRGFAQRVSEIYPGDVGLEVLRELGEDLPLSLRANSLRNTAQELRRELESAGFELAPVDWNPLAFCLPRENLRALQATVAHAEGRFYIQGLASMAVPLALEPQPGERILDMAAAPGSKTTQIAALMQGRGELVANDRSRNRCFKLRAILEQQGAGWVETLNRPGESLARPFEASFDRVLLDAPCSGEGRFRRGDPESWSDWKSSKIKRLAGEQLRLLRTAIRCLRPGGVLVYSTCTLAPEENELVVAKLLRQFGDEYALELEPIELGLPTRRPGLTEWRSRALPEALGNCLRIPPGCGYEGFFIARIRRGK